MIGVGRERASERAEESSEVVSEHHRAKGAEKHSVLVSSDLEHVDYAPQIVGLPPEDTVSLYTCFSPPCWPCRILTGPSLVAPHKETTPEARPHPLFLVSAARSPTTTS